MMSFIVFADMPAALMSHMQTFHLLFDASVGAANGGDERIEGYI
jgi:hypothetical protein